LEVYQGRPNRPVRFHLKLKLELANVRGT